jgi:predicted N-formylglutamate amidohydrolase
MIRSPDFIASGGDIRCTTRQQAIVQNSYELVSGNPESGLLLIADHASNHVPDDIDLGIAPALLDLHIALDIGVAPLAKALNQRIGCACILGGVSRLVIDLNREEDAPHIIPTASDGHAIPGNAISSEARLARIDRLWRPYHQKISDQIKAARPKMLISLHSFTPQLETQPDVARPWEIGILYNQDERAARIAIPMLEAAGVVVGDQLPYSGKLLNATMNLHGEANGIPYLGIEMRQDLISNAAGVAHWADLLAPVINTCANQITQL